MSQLDRPRLSAALLTIKGEAEAAPVKPAPIDGLAGIAHKKINLSRSPIA